MPYNWYENSISWNMLGPIKLSDLRHVRVDVAPSYESEFLWLSIRIAAHSHSSK